MRVRVSKRASLLVAFATMTAWVGGMVGAQADHGADDPSTAPYVQQAGNGSGVSAPVIKDFNLRTMLFSPLRFPDQQNFPRFNTTRYLAYGTVPVAAPLDTALAQLAVSQSDNGLAWSDPVNLTIKDPNGGPDLPFLVSELSQLAVSYGHTPFSSPVGVQDRQFAVYYHVPLDATNLNTISGIHVAGSKDGFTFEDDKAISQTGSSVISGATACANAADGFKCGSYGPTDIHINNSGSTAANCAVASPWNCRFVMIYNSTNGAQEYASIAGSGAGVSFTGVDKPIVCPGNSVGTPGCAATPGSWDDDTASYAHVRKIPSSINPSGFNFVLYYSGGQTPDNACFAGTAGCWSLGAATSTTGLSFLKLGTNPVTPRAFIDEWDTNDLGTLWNPIPLDIGKVDHNPIYYTRIDNLGQKDVFLAYTAPEPTAAPSVRFASPVGQRNRADTPIEVYLNDSKGTNIGLNLGTLTVKVDGGLISGYSVEQTMVDGYYYTGVKVARDGTLLHLPDGAHSVTVAVKDNDGNLTTKTSNFLIDTSAPVTTLSLVPAAQQVQLPTDSLGRFKGTTVAGDGLLVGSEINLIKVVVTNPLGLDKTYDLRYSATNSVIEVVTARKWNFDWVAPVVEPFFMLPGNYTVSFLGANKASSLERPSAANTYSIMVI